MRLFTAASALAAACASPDVIPLPMPVTFAIAGLSGMTAWLFIHPGDLVKTRMILLSKAKGQKGGDGRGSPALGPIAVARQIKKEAGVAGLYAGLSAALARQACYTTLRLGLYDLFKDQLLALAFRSRSGAVPDPATMFWLRQAAGLLSGAAASFANCPIEVCLVRMQGDGELPPARRRNYRGIFNALARIAREEGPLTFWRGAAVTVIRAMVVSVSQVSTYDQAKNSFAKHLSGLWLQLAASVTAALVFTSVSMPFETIKTRIQSSQGDDGGGDKSSATAAPTAREKSTASAAKGGGGRKSSGVFASLVTVAREEGVLGLWNGYLPYLVSKGVLTVLLFMIKERYTALAEALYNGDLSSSPLASWRLPRAKVA